MSARGSADAMSLATQWNMSLVFNGDASLVRGQVALAQDYEDVQRQSGWLKWSDHIEADIIDSIFTCGGTCKE